MLALAPAANATNCRVSEWVRLPCGVVGGTSTMDEWMRQCRIDWDCRRGLLARCVLPKDLINPKAPNHPNAAAPPDLLLMPMMGRAVAASRRSRSEIDPILPSKIYDSHGPSHARSHVTPAVHHAAVCERVCVHRSIDRRLAGQADGQQIDLLLLL